MMTGKFHGFGGNEVRFGFVSGSAMMDAGDYRVVKVCPMDFHLVRNWEGDDFSRYFG
jgi:hypothetical protein